MSKIGKSPITLPNGVSIDIKDEDIKIVGPKGELHVQTFKTLDISIKDNIVTVVPVAGMHADLSKDTKAKWGLLRALLMNSVIGVSNGYSKELEIVGIGYRVEKKGTNLVFHIGYSHTVEIKPLDGITLNSIGNTGVVVSGIDKQAVGQMSALIRKIRKPDAYKGKGIRYKGEVIKLKQGKSA